MHNKTRKREQADLNKLLNDKEFLEKTAQDVMKQMEENPGMTLQDATGISDKALEEVYCLAYNFYNQGKYQESIMLFQFLAGASPKAYKYILGLAASYHQIHAYEDAFACFYIALYLDPANPMPAYYATDCCLKQHLYGEALELAEVTSQICEDRPEYAQLKQRLELTIAALKLKK